MKIDWKAGFLPAMRTAGSLMVGNAGVTFLLGTTDYKVALTMFVFGFTIIVSMSLAKE